MMADLIEMGFGRGKALRALSRTGWIGVEAAVMWLLSNPDSICRTLGSVSHRNDHVTSVIHSVLIIGKQTIITYLLLVWKHNYLFVLKSNNFLVKHFQMVPRPPVREGGGDHAGQGQERELPRPRVSVQAGRLRAFSQDRRQGN